MPLNYGVADIGRHRSERDIYPSLRIRSERRKRESGIVSTNQNLARQSVHFVNSSGWLGYSVRELMQRAAKLILAGSTRGPDLDKRIDIYHDLEVFDPKLQRRHPITVRLRVTVRSRESDQSSLKSRA